MQGCTRPPIPALVRGTFATLVGIPHMLVRDSLFSWPSAGSFLLVIHGSILNLHGLMTMMALLCKSGYPLLSSVLRNLSQQVVEVAAIIFVATAVVQGSYKDSWSVVLLFVFYVLQCAELFWKVFRPLVKRRSNGEEKGLKVLTYNIQSCTGMDGQYDPRRTAEEIKKFQADIVCLQEIEKYCHLDVYNRPLNAVRQSDNQPSLLCELTELKNIAFLSTTNQFGGEWGCAVLSKHKILKVFSWTLKSSGKETHFSNLFFGPLDQGAIAVKIQPPEFHIPCWVICCHLGCDASGIEQMYELLEIDDFVNGQLSEELCHVILCGDFNSTGSTLEIASSSNWKDSWIESPQRITSKSIYFPFYSATHPSKLPVVKIDYILYKTLCKMESKEFHELRPLRSKITSTMASDHLPIFAEFEEVSNTDKTA
eukprot:TRINITY_DN56448_c0_g1_i1.p1 TRINITY_DN56448_c0_g1~~TRINITY_DN56448_c0_g1_i1.p1  ORF type:complete len:424 (-),score=65.64 TRINITY_DN56448_c0_g1_i1:26-1297(-)